MSYEIVPIERLTALQEFKMQQLCKEYLSFRKKWMKQNKCSCVKELEKEQIINCKHVAKAINDKYKKRKQVIWRLGLIILKKGLAQTKTNMEKQ